MLLLEAETPNGRGYLHEVNTPFGYSVDEDIANSHGDIAGPIFGFLEVTPHASISDPSQSRNEQKAGIARLIRLGTRAVPRPKG